MPRLGYSPGDFYDDSVYPLLEQPIPLLCADRLDYFLRDGLACDVVKPDFIERILGCLAVVDQQIVLTDVAVAREATALFARMNRDWWASPIEAFIYNEFADALREGLRLGAIEHDDLLTEDSLVLEKLEAAGSRKIAKKLALIRHLDPERARQLRTPNRSQGTLARSARADQRYGAADFDHYCEKRDAAGGVAGGSTKRAGCM